MGDYWAADDARPIHLKEVDALLKTLMALSVRLQDHRIDVLIDNMAVLHASEHQGCKDLCLPDLIKQVFALTCSLNVDLKLHYIPSQDNPANAPSRKHSWQNATLSPAAWLQLENAFGPHTCDLMAWDSNAMTHQGNRLRHFTPHPTPNPLFSGSERVCTGCVI